MRTDSRATCIMMLIAIASPSGLRAEPLFDAPYRWFPCSATVHAVAGSPRVGGTAAFAVVSHADERSLEVLARTASGDLSPSASIAVPTHPHGVAIADFNGDGCPDIAAGGYDPPGIVVIHGRCVGRFSAAVFIPLPTPVEGLSVGDIDADGRPDLVGWALEGGVVLLADDGDGFRAPVALPGSYGLGIPVGRIDPDPYPDIVQFTSSPTNCDLLTVRHGRGDGTFSGEPNPEHCGSAIMPRLADLDGDGHLDVVYALDDGVFGYTVYTSLNDGNGDLNKPATCTGGRVDGHYKEFLAGLVAGGDMDGDHVQDAIVVSGSEAGPLLTLALGNGCGRFHGGITHVVGSGDPPVFVDMDGDGRDELLQADGTGVSLFTGSAAGRYGQPPRVQGEDTSPRCVVAAHFDDGPTLDLAVPDGRLGCYDIVFGTGVNVAFAGVGLDGTGHGPGSIAAADLDLDGHADVVTSSDPFAVNTNIALGDGFGGFTSRQDLDIRGIVGVVRAGGDPYPEVLVLEPDSLIVLRNRGDTTFEPLHAWPGGGSGLEVCDLNGDGLDDVVIRNGSDLNVRFGGSAGLSPVAILAASSIGGGTHIVDVDGDGRLDVFDSFRGAPEWRRGHGDGTFDAPAKLGLPPAPAYIDYALADFNGDGLLDAAWPNRRVAVAFGRGGGSFSPPTWFGAGYEPIQVVAGDFRGGGPPDLAVLGTFYDGDDDHWAMIDLLPNQIPPGAPLGVGGPPARTTVFALGAPSPNPLRTGTRLRFAPGRAQQLSVRVLDIAGREVRTLLEGAAPAGEQDVVWDGRDARGLQVPPGVYLVNARDRSTSISRRVVVLR